MAGAKWKIPKPMTADFYSLPTDRKVTQRQGHEPATKPSKPWFLRGVPISAGAGSATRARAAASRVSAEKLISILRAGRGAFPHGACGWKAPAPRSPNPCALRPQAGSPGRQRRPTRSQSTQATAQAREAPRRTALPRSLGSWPCAQARSDPASQACRAPPKAPKNSTCTEHVEFLTSFLAL